MIALTSHREPAPRERLFSNRPELRRSLILDALYTHGMLVARVDTEAMASGLDVAAELGVVTPDLLDLLRTAHDYFVADLAAGTCDPEFASDETEEGDGLVPYFFTRIRPEKGDSLYQRLAWHATDASTPLYGDTVQVLEADSAVVCRAAALACEQRHTSLYVLTTQPGHHAAADRFGGYCFVNWVVLLARLLERSDRIPFVVDVDYHAGDGTAELLGAEQMVSLHCGEDYPYRPAGDPWAIPLPRQTDWEGYEPKLREALARRPAGCDVLVVSLGVDSLAGDPDSRPGHGLALQIADFGKMGAVIRSTGLQVLVVQEGGYHLPEVSGAVLAFCSALGGPHARA